MNPELAIEVKFACISGKSTNATQCSLPLSALSSLSSTLPASPPFLLSAPVLFLSPCLCCDLTLCFPLSPPSPEHIRGHFPSAPACSPSEAEQTQTQPQPQPLPHVTTPLSSWNVSSTTCHRRTLTETQAQAPRQTLAS
eukprot:1857547-Rhodomonas_salina.3